MLSLSIILRWQAKGQKNGQPQDSCGWPFVLERSDAALYLAREDAEDFADQPLILALFLQVFDFHVVEGVAWIRVLL